MSNRSFSKSVRLSRRICRWLFVLLTWVIAAVFLWDFWRLFRNFTFSLLFESSIPVLTGLLTLVVGIVLVRFQSIWLFKVFVCMLFFLSIALLYSYVGVRLTDRIGRLADYDQRLSPPERPAKTR